MLRGGSPRIYLDNAATTRPALEVVEAMRPFLDSAFGNPATRHWHGQQAARAVQVARENLAGLLGADPAEIVFTSGGTESVNAALLGAVLRGGRRHIVASAVEHHAVLETCRAFEAMGLGVSVTLLPADGEGRVRPDTLREALRDDTAIAAVMHANNEIGTIEPIAELAAITHERGALFLTDAVQSVGKVPIRLDEFGADLLALSAHKFHGPKGVGALVIRRQVGDFPPLLHGGGQEGGRRSGTLNVPGIAGLGMAAALAAGRLADASAAERVYRLTERLWQAIAAGIPEVRRNTPVSEVVPGILNISIAGVEGQALLLFLDIEGVSAAVGSACSSGAVEPSHVLRAIGVPAGFLHGSLRFSLSHETTEQEIDDAAGILAAVVARVRAIGPSRRLSE